MSIPRGPDSQRDWQMMGLATGLGCSVAASLLVCIGGGILIDRWLGIEPIGVLTGVVIGLFAAGYSFYELVTISSRKSTRATRNQDSGDANGDVPST